MMQVFQKKLKGARRVLVVGNGGIATELVLVILLVSDYYLHYCTVCFVLVC